VGGLLVDERSSLVLRDDGVNDPLACTRRAGPRQGCAPTSKSAVSPLRTTYSRLDAPTVTLRATRRSNAATSPVRARPAASPERAPYQHRLEHTRSAVRGEYEPSGLTTSTTLGPSGLKRVGVGVLATSMETNAGAGSCGTSTDTPPLSNAHRQ